MKMLNLHQKIIIKYKEKFIMKDDKKIELNEETIRAYNAGNLFAPEVNVEQYNDSKFR